MSISPQFDYFQFYSSWSSQATHAGLASEDTEEDVPPEEVPGEELLEIPNLDDRLRRELEVEVVEMRPSVYWTERFMEDTTLTITVPAVSRRVEELSRPKRFYLEYYNNNRTTPIWPIPRSTLEYQPSNRLKQLATPKVRNNIWSIDMSETRLQFAAPYIVVNSSQYSGTCVATVFIARVMFSPVTQTLESSSSPCFVKSVTSASSLERQSPRVTSCLAHSLCPREPSLQTTAVVSMGSADHQFNLAELLSQNYSLREGCAEAPRCPDKPEEELDKDFIAQSSDMPLDELLALYGYESSDPISEQESEGGDTAPTLPDMTLDKEQIAKDLLSGEEEEETQSSADDLTPSVTSHEASDLFHNQSGSRFLAGDNVPGSSASSDTEEDALPANKCKKEIMVGPQFQADLNILHLNRHCDKIYENEDQLLWSPSVLPEREVEEFLYRAVKRRWQEMAGPQIPEGEVVKDSEQALYELVKCNFNVEEALRRLRFNVKVIRDGLCAWSEEECRNFEHGFRVHGKNFHLIQANKHLVVPYNDYSFSSKRSDTFSDFRTPAICSLGFPHGNPRNNLVNVHEVRTRSVGECVEYYYLWKKSERYDYFAQQTRLGRRKFVSSGTTDAEQDLDGLDSDGPARLRPEQESEAGVPMEQPSVDVAAGGLDQPGAGSDHLLSSEPGPHPFEQLNEPPAVASLQQPSSLASPADLSPVVAAAPAAATPAPEPGTSPRLAVDLALPEELPLVSSPVDLSEDTAEPMAPAQVALSVTEFGLIGIGDVNPFLTGHPTCPASTLRSEPLSHPAFASPRPFRQAQPFPWAGHFPWPCDPGAAGTLRNSWDKRGSRASLGGGDMERRWVFVLLDVLCVLVASLPFIILTLVNTPYKRGFYCGDDSIRYPYRPDTITHGLMAGVIITATVILVSSGEAYLVYTERLYSRSDFNNYVAAIYKVLGTFLFGAAVSQSLTDLAKYMIGRLRPSFLAVCDPDWSRVNCSGYVQLEVCRGSPANVTEARLSFYSGHSSFGMYCMLFLALYVQARLCWKWARLLRPTVQFFLVAFAIYVGYTRVSDHKHHWSDVLVGLLQGALVACLTVSPACLVL
ncbi:lipid phosphate phosphohydrolase 2-like protein [Cricetulus griseus]|nr:lipid phosphate phosphohydrolase 2-like protein [Cricetulus griseus]